MGNTNSRRFKGRHTLDSTNSRRFKGRHIPGSSDSSLIILVGCSAIIFAMPHKLVLQPNYFELVATKGKQQHPEHSNQPANAHILLANTRTETRNKQASECRVVFCQYY